MLRIIFPIWLLFSSNVCASAANMSIENMPIKESSVIVVGVVQEQLSIIHPDKFSNTRTQTLPDGRRITDLPNPMEYMAGFLYRLHVE